MKHNKGFGIPCLKKKKKKGRGKWDTKGVGRIAVQRLDML